MFLVVGLGNPGKKYRNNRHNIGFLTLEAIIQKFELSSAKSEFDSEVFKGEIERVKVIAIKPQTFMNLSGKSVAAFVRFYKIPVENVIVIHDDLDLAFGKIRIKTGGGSGGHNGIKSIDSLMAKDYIRIKIGIGHPGHRDLVSDYVLDNFTEEEKGKIEEIIEKAIEELSLVVNKEKENGV